MVSFPIVRVMKHTLDLPDGDHRKEAGKEQEQRKEQPKASNECRDVNNGGRET